MEKRYQIDCTHCVEDTLVKSHAEARRQGCECACHLPRRERERRIQKEYDRAYARSPRVAY